MIRRQVARNGTSVTALVYVAERLNVSCDVEPVSFQDTFSREGKGRGGKVGIIL